MEICRTFVPFVGLKNYQGSTFWLFWSLDVPPSPLRVIYYSFLVVEEHRKKNINIMLGNIYSFRVCGNPMKLFAPLTVQFFSGVRRLETNKTNLMPIICFVLQWNYHRDFTISKKTLETHSEFICGSLKFISCPAETRRARRVSDEMQ